MTYLKFTVLITTILAAALLSGVVAGCGDSKSTSVSTDASEAKEKEATGVDLELKRAKWKTDTRYLYELRLTSKADMPAQGSMFEFDLTADLAVVPVENGPKGTQLMLTLENPVFHSKQENEETKKQFEKLTQEVKAPFFAGYENGIMLDVHLSKDTTAFAAGIHRTIAAAFQNATSDAPAKTWQVTEYDATGAYVAEYSVVKSKAIQKRKVEYTKTLKDKREGKALAQDIGAPQVTSSTGEIIVKDEAIQKITLSDSCKMPVAIGSALSSKTELSLELKEQKPHTASAAFKDLQKSYKRYGRDEAFLNPVSQEVLDAARMRGMTFDQVVAQLEEMAKDPEQLKELQKAVQAGLDEKQAMATGKKWMGNWMTLFNALPAFFRQEPGTVDKAVRLIEKQSPAVESLLGGLSAAGTEASQQALLRIAQGKNTPEVVKESAMVSLIRCKDPQPSTTKALTDMLEGRGDLRVYAIYGLGTMSRNLRDGGNADESKALAAKLTEALEQTKNRSEKTNILYGIANSGYAGALEAVKPYLSHRDPSLRSAALAAIRLMDRPEVDALIAAGMDPKKEQERTVREAAILAAKPRQPSSILAEALSKAALEDEMKSVRFNAIKLLARWLPTRPEVRQTLEKAAQNEDEHVIRGTAAAALKKYPANP